MLNFVTLFDKNYLSRGLVLYYSLKKHCIQGFRLYILSMDEYVINFFKDKKMKGIVPISLSEVMDYYPVLKKIREERSRGEFCWTMSSFSIQYVLKAYDLPSVTYLDSDLCFFSSPTVLFDELSDKSVLITEHNYYYEYDQSMDSGKFCVQFMYFKNDDGGNKVLEWWRSKCEEWCYNRYEDGKFGDQKYLDDWESRFDGIVYNCKNIGCGLAPWNCQKYNIIREGNAYYVEDKISKVKKNLIFYHFHNLHKLKNHRWSLSNYKITKDIIPIYLCYIKYLEKIESKLPSEYISKEIDEKELHEKNRFIRSVYGGLKHIFYLYRKVSQTKNNIITLN